jgi:ferrous iron transport protein A
MKKNQAYRVLGFSADCPPEYQRKFMAMGFTPGAFFYAVRQAPLGDPWQIEIKGVMLSLRKIELQWIRFEEHHD